jgi:hypothetical protein
MSKASTLSESKPAKVTLATDCRPATTVEVSKAWSFALDPRNEGRHLSWEKHPPQASTTLDAGHPWEYWHPGYDGVAWYWKEISFGEVTPGRVMQVRFEAVSYWCECWMNGHRLGTHEGLYDEFAFDVTPFLDKHGKNLLAVRVINPPADREIEGLRSGAPLNQSDLPIGKSAWYYNFGGLWGRVWLDSLPTIHFTDLWVDPDHQAGKLTLRWSTWNAAEVDECEMTAVVRHRKSGQVVSTTSRTIVIDTKDAAGTWVLDVKDCAEWSIEDPNLYLLEVAVSSSYGVHSISRQFGVRDFRLEDGKFVLNGRKVRLKGLLHQGAYPLRLAAPHSWRMGARELLTVKRAGFNFVRIHLKPAPAWYLDLADRLGILVMMEPPTGWIANGPLTEERVLREVKVLIRANRSRACVVIWGLFNESFHLAGYVPGEMRELAARVMQAAKQEDDSRLIIDTSGGYSRASLQGAETMIHNTFRNVPSRYMSPRSQEVREIVDVHVYCAMPPTVDLVDNYRSLNPGSLPLFLAEYGAAEMPPDFSKVLATYSERDREIGLEDWQLHEDFFLSLSQRFEEAALSQEFPGVAEWIASLSFERARELAAITLAARCNPHLAGFCHCQLADASGELFGVLDFWRRPKPVLSALASSISDPAAGLFPERRWITRGETLQATLAIVSDADSPQLGQAEIEIVCPDGSRQSIFSEDFCCEPQSSIEKPLSFLPDRDGLHEIRGRTVLLDGRVSEFCEKFGVLSEPTGAPIKVSGRFSDPSSEKKIAACGVKLEPFGNNYRNKNSVVVLEWSAIAKSVNSHCEILGQIRNIAHAGGVAIILHPDTPMLHRWLLPAFIGAQPVNRTDVYLKASPVFNDLPNGCVAGSLFASVLCDRWDNAEDVAAAGGIIDVGAFSAHMWTRPAKYFWAAGLYRIPLGRGQIFISHLKLLDQMESDPLSRKIFRNLLSHAAGFIQPGKDELLFHRCIDSIESLVH